MPDIDNHLHLREEPVKAYDPAYLVEQKIIQRLVKDLQNQTILDLGCGDCYCRRFLGKSNRVVSIGVLSEGIEKRPDCDRCQPTIIGNPAQLPFDSESFDTVLSLGVLECLKKDLKAVREISRVLKPGGKLIISVPEDIVLFSNIDVSSGRYRRYSKKELESLLPDRLECEVLSDYGYPFMRLYLQCLGKLYTIDGPKAYLQAFFSSIVARCLAKFLAFLFAAESKVFQGNFKGAQLYGVFRKR